MQVFSELVSQQELTEGEKFSKFRLYGQNVNCSFPLPFPKAAFQKADIEVCLQDITTRPTHPAPDNLVREWISQNSRQVLRYVRKNGRILEFVFDQQGKIIRIRQSYPEWQDTMFAMLNPAMAASLHLQGVPVFHATSLVRNGTSFIFAGRSGVGKSTLAAALVSEGLGFHADDIAAFCFKGKKAHVQAGYPRLKVTPQISHTLGWNERDLLDVFISEPEYEEKWVDISHMGKGFYNECAPLGAIFIFVGRSSGYKTPRIDMMPPGRAALILARYLYGSLWLQKPDIRTMTVCAKIADSVPVFALRLPDALDSLRPSARFVVRYLNRLSGKDLLSCKNAGVR